MKAATAGMLRDHNGDADDPAECSEVFCVFLYTTARCFRVGEDDDL